MALSLESANAQLETAVTSADDSAVYEAVLDVFDRLVAGRLPAHDLATWAHAASARLLARGLTLDALTTYAPLEPRMSPLIFRLQDTELSALWPAAELPNLLSLGVGTADIDWNAMPDCHWPRLQTVTLYEGPGVGNGFFPWLSRQELPALRQLSAYKVGMTHNDLAALHRSSFWAALEELNLGRNTIGSETAWPPLPGIRVLEIARSDQSARTLASITATPLHALRVLDISGNAVGNVGFDFLARRHLPTLQRLAARSCKLTDGHTWRSLRSASWPALRDLDLQDDLSDASLVADLVVVFRQLEALDVSSTQLSDDGVMELAHFDLPCMATLSMLFNQVSDVGAIALAGASLPALRRLYVSGNPIGDRGIEAMTRASWWNDLEVLGIVNLELSDAGLLALAGRIPPGLRELRLLARPYTPEAVEAVRRALPPGATLV